MAVNAAVESQALDKGGQHVYIKRRWKNNGVYG